MMQVHKFKRPNRKTCSVAGAEKQPANSSCSFHWEPGSWLKLFVLLLQFDITVAHHPSLGPGWWLWMHTHPCSVGVVQHRAVRSQVPAKWSRAPTVGLTMKLWKLQPLYRLPDAASEALLWNHPAQETSSSPRIVPPSNWAHPPGYRWAAGSCSAVGAFWSVSEGTVLLTEPVSFIY